MRLIANSFLTTSLVVLTALAAGQARAADVDASSAVDAVTVYPDGASVTRVITLDLPAGDNSAVLKDFPLTLDPSSLRVEGEAGAKLTIGAIDARPPRAAPPVNLPELDKRIEALKDERADLQGAMDAGDRAAKIRRAVCASFAGRDRRKGRGAADRRMARGLCRGRRGNRQRRCRDPRCRAQAARTRPRNRAARTGPGAEAAEQAGSADRTCGGGCDQSDAAGDLCGAQCALGAALRCPARHRREGSQARARTGAPRRNHAGHRRGLVECRAERFDRAHSARRQRARSEFADRAISATAASDAACRTVRGARELRHRGPAAAVRLAAGNSDRGRDGEGGAEQQAAADVGGFQVVFRIPGRVSLGASEGAKSLRVSTATIAPDLAVRAAPVKDPTAFLEASFKQNEDAPLLPGRVSIYRDGVFVGRGQMAAASKDETVRLGFGADDKVKIERTVLKRNEGSAGLIVTTSKTDERAFKTTCATATTSRSGSRSRTSCRSARTRKSRSKCCRPRRRRPRATCATSAACWNGLLRPRPAR